MQYTKNNPLRVVTLCSGYDSQCLALNRLREAYPDFDYTLVAWSEWDPESNVPTDRQPAVIAHKALFPQWADRNLGDMTKIDWSKVDDFDLLFYSTPCTDFSNAGKQAGGEEGSGTRSSILWWTRYAILEKKPKYLIMENVKALVSGKFITLFRKWLDEMYYLALPLIVMTFCSLGGMTRYVRAAMIEALSMDCIRTARAKGCKESVVIN